MCPAALKSMPAIAELHAPIGVGSIALLGVIVFPQVAFLNPRYLT
jgi:hypothetical protein